MVNLHEIVITFLGRNTPNNKFINSINYQRHVALLLEQFGAINLYLEGAAISVSTMLVYI